MSRLGAYKSDTGVGVVVAEAYGEIASPVGTTAAALEDITGLTVDVTVPTGLPSTACVCATMTFQNSTTGGSPATGGWAISIAASDKQEIQRYLSGTSDTGIGVVLGRTAGLGAGTYTVKGRHRRVSGTSTVNTDVAQLQVQVITE